LRGDVRIFYIILVYYVALYVLGTSFSASTLFSFSFLFYILIYISTKIKRRWKGRKEIKRHDSDYNLEEKGDRGGDIWPTITILLRRT
jgi:hypothetical protein